MRFSSWMISVIAVGSTLALSASAADDKKDEKKPEDASATTTTKSTDGAADNPAAPSPTTGEVTTTNATPGATTTEQPANSSDPKEVAGQTYYFLGARYRHTFLPTGMLHLFVDGGPSTAVSIPSFGVEGSMRKDDFEIIGAITYADYSLGAFPFKGKSEADTAYEIVKSNLKLINLSADFLWGTDFSPKFAFQYGVTAGLAIVLGDLHRNQAKPATGSAPGDPYSYVPCNGVADPGSGAYCDNSNDHYGDYTDASWFNGGKKPNFYPIFGPMFAFRWKPVKQFVARLDGGFNLFSGFFFGVGLNYGF
jgi:hypothetical protein